MQLSSLVFINQFNKNWIYSIMVQSVSTYLSIPINSWHFLFLIVFSFDSIVACAYSKSSTTLSGLPKAKESTTLSKTIIEMPVITIITLDVKNLNILRMKNHKNSEYSVSIYLCISERNCQGWSVSIAISCQFLDAFSMHLKKLSPKIFWAQTFSTQSIPGPKFFKPSLPEASELLRTRLDARASLAPSPVSP